jgi:hypothetical protein
VADDLVARLRWIAEAGQCDCHICHTATQAANRITELEHQLNQETPMPRTRTTSADTINMINRELETARTNGDRHLTTILGLIKGLIQQFVNVTPNNTLWLPCQPCGGTGRIPKWFHATGETIDVFCPGCQGAGETWNPHPQAAHPNIKGEM